MRLVVRLYSQRRLLDAVHLFLHSVRQLTRVDLKISGLITRSMASAESTFCPPQRVLNMRELTDESKLNFRKEVIVPAIVFPANLINRLIGCKTIFDHALKKFSKRIKPIMDIPTTSNKCILFDPDQLDDKVRSEILEAISNITNQSVNFEERHLTLSYEDWSAKQCINAILPEGLLFSGFSQVGHIVHVNLREELLPYKLAIGKILLEKINNCRTVVNKLESIENEYRVFELDLLAGEPEYVTEMREGGLRYKLDFSKVFWNSRLSSEHDRITRKFNVHSAVFDCCAGVGPFVLPAAKRGASVVIANDLNPESVKWLQENIKINRSNIGKSEILVRCMDAREFIRTEVASRIAAEAQRSKGIDEVDKQDDDKIPNCPEIREVHLLMNLPASSLSFLPCFRGILFDRIPKGDLPFTVIVHCHLFVKAHADEEEQWYAEEAKRLVIEHLGYEKVRFKEVHFVRKVAGRKAMYCVSFELPGEVLFEEKHEDNKSEKGDNAEKNILSSSDHGNGLPDTRKDGSPPPLKIARIEPIGECLR